jgi:adenosylhomocysteine nucleosidase
MKAVNRENADLCVVFPMGMEAHPFLRRVQVLRRWKSGRATYREVFFEGSVFMTVRCGIGPAKAAAAVRNLDRKPSVIINAGTAGSLVENVNLSELVISCETLFGHEPSNVLQSSAHLVRTAAAACCSARVSHTIGRIATVSDPVFSREDRQRLHCLTGAQAVDMESHAISEEARKLGIPFVSVRVISDDLNSPPLPTHRDLKSVFRNPLGAPAELKRFLQWKRFLINLRKSIQILHPVLVGLVRTYRKENGFLDRSSS